MGRVGIRNVVLCCLTIRVCIQVGSKNWYHCFLCFLKHVGFLEVLDTCVVLTHVKSLFFFVFKVNSADVFPIYTKLSVLKF